MGFLGRSMFLCAALVDLSAYNIIFLCHSFPVANSRWRRRARREAEPTGGSAPWVRPPRRSGRGGDRLREERFAAEIAGLQRHRDRLRPGRDAPRHARRDLRADAELRDAERGRDRTRGLAAGDHEAADPGVAEPGCDPRQRLLDHRRGALGAELSCTALTSAGVAVAETRQGPCSSCASAQDVASAAVSRPSARAIGSSLSIGCASAKRRTCALVASEQLPERQATGPPTAGTVVAASPPRSRRSRGARPRARPEPPVTRAKSSHASPIAARSSPVTVSTTMNGLPAARSAGRGGPDCGRARGDGVVTDEADAERTSAATARG